MPDQPLPPTSRWRVAVTATALGLSACADRGDYPSPCTDAPVTVLDARWQTLRSDASPPAFVDTDEATGTRIELGFDDVQADLAKRAVQVPLAASAARALAETVRAANRRGDVVVAGQFVIDASAAEESRRAQIHLAHEASALVTRGLRDGFARVVQDGRRVGRITVQYYEGEDDVGKTNGVRFIAGGRVVHDYCATDPRD